MCGSQIRHRGVGAVVAAMGVFIALASPANGDVTSGRLSLESAHKGTGTCQDPSAVCLPDGRYTITIGNTNPGACRFDVTVSWGDGTTEQYVLGPSRDVSHQYLSPGVYTVTASGVGTPLQPDATCTGGSGSVKVEVPEGVGVSPEVSDLSPEVSDLLGGIVGLASDFDQDLDRFLKLKLNKESKKLRKGVDELVRDGRLAKELRRDFRQLDVPQEGDVAFPCPAPQARAAKRACPAGAEVAEKLEDLWGFLSSLRELADYPAYQRKKADQYYQTQEGKARMDFLTNICGDCRGKTEYSQLDDDQKQIIASQIQVHSGAVQRALRDAQKAGKAGTEVAF